MLEAMLEGCVPIVRRTHNGRTAWVPLHSAHARADRETLKAALREALGRVEFLRDESSDGSADRGFAVLNIQGSAPPSNGSESELFALMNEILSEEPPLHAHVKQRLSERVELSKTKTLVRPGMSGDPLPPPVPGPPPGTMFTPDRHVQLRWPDLPWARGDLLHPPWYLGFIHNTEVRIQIPYLYRATYAKGEILFGPRGPKQPKLEFELHANSTPVYFRSNPAQGPYYEVSDPPGGNITLPIAHLYDNPTLPFGGSENVLGHFIEQHQSRLTRPVEGWLIVWHTDQWSKQFVVGRTIDGAWGSYIYPDYFQDVSIRLTVANRTTGALAIESVRILLNNGIILDSAYDNFNLVDWNTSLDLKQEIENFRENLMLFNGHVLHETAPTYNPSLIRNNPILKTAKNDLFTAWTRRNGMPWDHVGPLWHKLPDGWCTAFVAWHFLQAYPGSGFPVGVEGSGHNWFAEHMDEGRYICPFSVDPETNNFYRYEDLGNTVLPGDSFSLRNWGHRNFFLYWLDTRMRTRNYTDASDVHQTVDDGPLDNLRPGRFEPRSVINWFRAIGGNQGGSRVTIGAYAVILLESDGYHIIRDLTSDDETMRTTAVIWCSSYLNRYPRDETDGFGRYQIPGSRERIG